VEHAQFRKCDDELSFISPFQIAKCKRSRLFGLKPIEFVKHLVGNVGEVEVSLGVSRQEVGTNRQPPGLGMRGRFFGPP